jgi:hypothetical protein
MARMVWLGPVRDSRIEDDAGVFARELKGRMLTPLDR